MLRPVAVSTLLTVLVSSAAVQGGFGHHEGHRVFYQDRFDENAAQKAAGVTVDPETQELVLEEGTGHPYVRTGIFLSVPARAARSFSAAFPSWRASVPQGTSVELAFRFAPEADGPWSRWQPVECEADMQLGGTYRYIQFRAFLTSDDGSHTPRIGAVSLHFGLGKSESEIEPGVEADLPRPELVTRAQWGARQARDPYTAHSPNRLVVHHSSSPNAAAYRGASTIRGIQNYHMDAPSHNWIDIGYHFLIGPDGMIFEGRPETVSGAHVIPNPNKIGICVIGNFEPPSEDQPSGVQYERLVDLLAHLAGKYGISPAGIGGHRDYMSTDCPGQSLYGRLGEIRAEVGRRIESASSGR
ncbi:MAG: N-acetylmuramoyl-L-alanine amidase [Candidatus Wallbacteria bacterium]|nr:N-acetylmuramoyl-L-alanine amidase [Candidatus Wallbacteria bacterium]